MFYHYGYGDRSDRSTPGFIGEGSEHFLSHTFRLPRTFARSLHISPTKSIRGINWRARLDVFESEDKWISFKLQCGGPSNDEGSDWSCVVTPMQLRILSNANAVTEIFPVLRPHTFDSKEWTECDLTSIAWESLMDGFYPDERRAEGYLTLEVRFKIKLMEPGTVIEIGEDMDLKGLQEEAHTDLMNDMTKLLLETESDLILVSRDGEEVPCHGLILTARCPPFKAMLASGLKETEERRVEITDVGTEELKLLVKFLYTGDITEDVEDIAGTGTDVMKGVLIAADKYELPQLMKYAAHGLKLRRCSKDAWELLECLKMYENELPDAVKEWKQFVIQNVREIVGV